nr:Toll/interleukin-1 receptor (TIR) domain-containing protein [Tanacetum cinerariifolium]
RLPQLKVLQLEYLERLVSTPDFNGLPNLQKLELNECYELEEIHPSLGNHRSLKYVDVSYCSKLRMFPTIVRMEQLESLSITHCDESLVFPEIQSNMKCLVKLDLHHIQIDGLLSSIGERCTNLISLSLERCFNVNSTESTVIDGNRLLQSMLKGNAIENQSMQLRIKGLEKPKQFTNRLYAGDQCREEVSDDMSGMFHDVVWGESFGGKLTWVWYVPFASLRCTEWWNPTHKNVSFDIYHCNTKPSNYLGIGASLVPMNNGSGLTDSSIDSSEFTDDYTQNFSIHYDSKSSLTISPRVYGC